MYMYKGKKGRKSMDQDHGFRGHKPSDPSNFLCIVLFHQCLQLPLKFQIETIAIAFHEKHTRMFALPIERISQI